MPRRCGARSAIVGLAMTLFGCGGAGDAGSEELSHPEAVEGSDPGPGAWAPGEEWRVQFEPRATIGVVDGLPQEELQDISAGLRAPDGTILLADAAAGTVRGYSAEGRYLTTLGGPGDGPGEFRRPIQVARDSGGGLRVWDGASERLTRFDATGRLEGVERAGLERLVPHLDPGWYPVEGLWLADGGMVFRLIRKAGDDNAKAALPLRADPVARREPEGSGVARYGAGFAQGEIVARLQGDEEVVVEAPWGPTPLGPPLGRGTRIAVQPGVGRFCFGDQSAPAITCHAPDGLPIEIRWTPSARTVPPGAAELRRWRDSVASDYALKLASAEVERLLDQVPSPAGRPPYAGMTLDWEGHLWVDLGATEGSSGREHLVFDPTGLRLGRVATPDVEILEIGLDYMLGVRTDAFGVQSVGVYTLDRSPRP